MKINLTYKINEPLDIKTASQFYRQSTLADQRPSDYPDALQQMLKSANLIVTARDGDRLVGISRTMTDFCYVAYLADLAVHQAYRNKNIERQLIIETQAQLAPDCMVVFIATLAGEHYFQTMGFSEHYPTYIIKAEKLVYS